MSPAEAHRVLGLEEGAGRSEVQAAVERRQKEIEGRIATAPTAALKKKYALELERVSLAANALQEAPPLPGGSENLPVLAIGDETAAPKVALKSMEDREEKGRSRVLSVLGAW